MLTVVSVFLMQYLVADYAPDETKLKKSISDLKCKIPLQLIFCLTLFFRGVWSPLVSSFSFAKISSATFDTSTSDNIVWNLILILMGGSALSVAVCSRYIGPCAIAKCSWTPLYVQTYRPNESPIQKICNTLFKLLPSWGTHDKQSEFDRKRRAFYQQHPHNLFQDATATAMPEPRKLFGGEQQKTDVDVHPSVSNTTSKNVRTYWIPKKSASAPLQPTILSTFSYTVAGTIYGYCMTSCFFFMDDPSNNNNTARKWCIVTSAISSAWFLFISAFRPELPLQNLYVGQQNKWIFIRESVQEAIQQLFVMLLVFQVLIACFLSTQLMDEVTAAHNNNYNDMKANALLSTVWHLGSTVMTAFAISILTIAQLALSDCIVGFFVVERIRLTSLAQYTKAPLSLSALCVLLAVCENRKDWILQLDATSHCDEHRGRSMTSTSQQHRAIRLDQEQQEIQRNQAAIEQIIRAWMIQQTSQQQGKTIMSSNDEDGEFFHNKSNISFSDEVSRAVILEALGGGGELFWNHTTASDIAGEKRHDKEVSELVLSRNSHEVCLPVARALAASVGAVGEMLIRSTSKQQSANRSNAPLQQQKDQEEEEYVIVRLPSSAIVQAQFAMVAISRIICKTHELKGKYHPVMSLVPAVLESIFQLRFGLICFAIAIAKRQGVIKNTDKNYDAKIGRVISQVCPEISSLFVACDVAAKSICGTFERGEQNIKLLRVSPNCREWVDKL
eukprot:CAMPEP_0116014550 /NCGR_PEP_ID=MMETSP0321-20121206/6332_1 /TAXON_ID=163516 /ORGANISM="Leptocylindrus danicus var. danicus, Strain B650" /LENGTH=728 /DNA_ID=CAMNT_0003484199 /DNA_START=156 /DNA_END=2342 /DNA_ORIENTATION=+